MFTVDAIREARLYTMFADDLFDVTEHLLKGTPYEGIKYDLIRELVYYYIYSNSYVDKLRVTYTNMTNNIVTLINDYVRKPLFDEDSNLEDLLNPLMSEMKLLFEPLTINRWGMITVLVSHDFIEISYIGDYRIIQWSQSNDAKRFLRDIPREQIYNEPNHCFKSK